MQLTEKGDPRLRVSSSNPLAKTTREPDPEPPEFSSIQRTKVNV